MDITPIILLVIYVYSVYSLNRDVDQKKKINYYGYGFAIGLSGALLFSILAEFFVGKKISSLGARKNLHFGMLCGIFVSVAMLGILL